MLPKKFSLSSFCSDKGNKQRNHTASGILFWLWEKEYFPAPQFTSPGTLLHSMTLNASKAYSEKERSKQQYCLLPECSETPSKWWALRSPFRNFWCPHFLFKTYFQNTTSPIHQPIYSSVPTIRPLTHYKQVAWAQHLPLYNITLMVWMWTQSHVFEHLVPKWWHSLGRLWNF